MRPSVLTIICLLAALTASAAVPTASDSIAGRHPTFPTAGIATGASAVVLAVTARQAYPHTGFPSGEGFERSSRGTSVLQFVPTALPWVMKAAGCPTRSGWARMTAANAASLALTAAMVYPIKNAVTSPRPDATDTRSFPSGHAAWAFAGATIVERELGWRSGWYTLGAYAFATGIALERVIDRHHYPTDVIAGAGFGILATRLGYWVTDLVAGNRGLEHGGYNITSDNDNLSYFSLETGLNLPLGPVDFGSGVKLIRLPAIQAGFRGGFAVDDNWGLAVEAAVQSTPLLIDVRHDRTNIAPLTAVGVILSPYYRYALSSRVSLSAEAGGGYFKNFHLNSVDRTITASGGSPVGRINFGAIMRFSDHFSLRASAGCQLSRYSYTITPSKAYHCEISAHRSGLTPSLLFNLSTRYEF